MTLLDQVRTGFAGIEVDAGVKAKALGYVEQWLKDAAFSSYKPQLEYLIQKGDWAGILDRYYQILPFGTGGRRGAVGIGLNRMNTWTLTASVQGHAAFLKEKFPTLSEIHVVVAFDVRKFLDTRKQYNPSLPNPVMGLSSRDLAHLAARVYAANSIICHVLPPDSPRYYATPELAYAIRHLKAHGGLNISASHNPPDDNGGKFYDEYGSQPVPPDDQIMADLVDQVTTIQMIEWNDAVQQKLIRFMDDGVHRAYLDLLLKLSLVEAPRAGECKVVYTPLHGVGGMTVKELLEKRGFDVLPVPSQMEPNGQFPNVPSPNPEVPASMEAATKIAQENKADLVLSSDPDADRLGAMIPSPSGWRFVNGNELCAMLTHFRLEQLLVQGRLPKSPLVITTLVTTGQVSRIARRFGVQLVNDLLVGFKYHADVLNQLERTGQFGEITGRPEDLVMASEESHGVLVSPEIRDKDSGGGSLLMAELALHQKRRGLTTFDYLQYLNKTYGCFYNSVQNLVMTGILGKQQMLAMLQSLRNDPPKEIAGRKVTQFEDLLREDGRLGVHKGETDKLGRNLLVFRLEGEARVALRPSGTEPKAKAYIELCTAPSPPGYLNAEWQKQCEELPKVGDALGKEFVKIAMARIGQ